MDKGGWLRGLGLIKDLSMITAIKAKMNDQTLGENTRRGRSDRINVNPSGFGAKHIDSQIARTIKGDLNFPLFRYHREYPALRYPRYLIPVPETK